MTTVGSPFMWACFMAFVLLMLAIDLGVFHRKAHEVSLKEAGAWSLVWVALAMVFNGAIYHWFGMERSMEFLTGYVIEKALAVDNIFVFVIIFSAFKIPAIYQHRVLFWGVLGALAMRAVFILLGGALIAKFHWVLYIFGALLVATGVKLIAQKTAEPNVLDNPLVKAFRRVFPVVPQLEGDKFLVKKDQRWHATPLLLALAAVEFTDLVFAVDSIPAIFAITTDPFIVFTSNIFAILGLRSMYFLLAGIIHRFVYLKVGLALVLVFVGAKMLLADFYKVPIGASLVVIATLIGGAVLVSLMKSPKALGVGSKGAL